MIIAEPNPQTTISDWIGDIPPSQQRLLIQLDQNSTDGLEAFNVWLDSLSPVGFAGYGTGVDPQQLTSAKILIRNSVHDFLCSEKKELVEQRKQYAQMSGFTATAFVGVTCTYVAPLVPLSVAFIVPGVAILLCFAAQIGKAAFCARLTELRALDQPLLATGQLDGAENPDDQ